MKNKIHHFIINQKFYILIKKGKIMNDNKVIATVFVLVTLAISIQLIL